MNIFSFNPSQDTPYEFLQQSREICSLTNQALSSFPTHHRIPPEIDTKFLTLHPLNFITPVLENPDYSSKIYTQLSNRENEFAFSKSGMAEEAPLLEAERLNRANAINPIERIIKTETFDFKKLNEKFQSPEEKHDVQTNVTGRVQAINPIKEMLEKAFIDSKKLAIIQKIYQYAKQCWDFLSQKAIDLANLMDKIRKRVKLVDIKLIDIKVALNIQNLFNFSSGPRQVINLHVNLPAGTMTKAELIQSLASLSLSSGIKEEIICSQLEADRIKPVAEHVLAIPNHAAIERLVYKRKQNEQLNRSRLPRRRFSVS